MSSWDRSTVSATLLRSSRERSRPPCPWKRSRSISVSSRSGRQGLARTALPPVIDKIPAGNGLHIVALEAREPFHDGEGNLREFGAWWFSRAALRVHAGTIAGPIRYGADRYDAQKPLI